MLALPVPAVSSAPMVDVSTAAETAPGSPLVAIVVAVAVLVLVTVALDLRKLRRASRLRAVHGVLAGVFSLIVVGGALTLSMALGFVPPATADQQDVPTTWPASEPESIDTSDVTDPTTDLELPTLSFE